MQYIRLKQINQTELAEFVQQNGVDFSGDAIRSGLFNQNVSNARITGSGILQMYDTVLSGWRTIWLESGIFKVESGINL